MQLKVFLSRAFVYVNNLDSEISIHGQQETIENQVKGKACIANYSRFVVIGLHKCPSEWLRFCKSYDAPAMQISQ